MTREEPLLNDFDGFERFLFTEEERLLDEEIPYEIAHYEWERRSGCRNKKN